MRLGRRRGPARPPAGTLPRAAAGGARPATWASWERFRRTRRLRGERRRRVLPWLVGLLAVAVVAGAAWVLGWSSLLALDEVRVEGSSPAVRTEVLAAVRGSGAATPGTPLARVDADAVAASADSVRAVASAEVVRDWPHALVVRVTERTPAVALRLGGAYLLVDPSGVHFTTVSKRPRGVPLLVADTGESGRSARAAAVRAYRSLPADLADRVTAVRARTPDDIRFSFGEAVTVRWGSDAEPQQKATVLTALLPRRAALYDVSAPDLPVVQGRAAS